MQVRCGYWLDHQVDVRAMKVFVSSPNLHQMLALGFSIGRKSSRTRQSGAEKSGRRCIWNRHHDLHPPDENLVIPGPRHQVVPANVCHPGKQNHDQGRCRREPTPDRSIATPRPAIGPDRLPPAGFGREFDHHRKRGRMLARGPLEQFACGAAAGEHEQIVRLGGSRQGPVQTAARIELDQGFVRGGWQVCGASQTRARLRSERFPPRSGTIPAGARARKAPRARSSPRGPRLRCPLRGPAKRN